MIIKVAFWVDQQNKTILCEAPVCLTLFCCLRRRVLFQFCEEHNTFPDDCTIRTLVITTHTHRAHTHTHTHKWLQQTFCDSVARPLLVPQTDRVIKSSLQCMQWQDRSTLADAVFSVLVIVLLWLQVSRVDMWNDSGKGWRESVHSSEWGILVQPSISDTQTIKNLTVCLVTLSLVLMWVVYFLNHFRVFPITLHI